MQNVSRVVVAYMIFVTGCARSGTSLTTQLLQAHKCNLGRSEDVNVLYENTGIRQNVLKPYLVSLGADPLGQRGFPDTDSLQPLPDLAQRVDAYLGKSEPRAYKDAKLTFVWPVFADAYPDAKWVLVRRNEERIIDSCLAASFMFAYSDRLGWQHWIDEHLLRFERMRAELSLIEFWPDQLFRDARAFEFVTRYCGLEFNETATRKAIDKKQWHEA